MQHLWVLRDSNLPYRRLPNAQPLRLSSGVHNMDPLWALGYSLPSLLVPEVHSRR